MSVQTFSAHPGASAGRQGRRAGGAFTLIEILIVVAILGLLAAIVIPELGSASRQAREGVMKDDLRFMREQIFRYKIQHDDVGPGYPPANPAGAPTEAFFIAQMTTHTDLFGNADPNGSNTYKYGPYLTKIPDNPLTGRPGILIVPNGAPIPAPDGTQPYGWIYKPETSEFTPNQPGTDLQGKAYSSY